MPTGTIGKTREAPRITHLAWCVCVLRGKGKAVSGVFRFAELLTTFRRSLWKVFLGAFVLGFN